MHERENVTIVECPRDAWQGLPQVIPTEVKARYLAQLIGAGFRHIDAVSFVAPRHVPQMADSEAVLQLLDERQLLQTDTIDIIAIVVNDRGVERALAAPGVRCLGYPHSLSETFLQQNAHSTVDASRALVERMQGAAVRAGRQLVVYLSMAFGNPYGDPWDSERVEQEVLWLKRTGVRLISLADTVGAAQPEMIEGLFRAVHAAGAGMEIGVHLHSRAENVSEKVLAAFEAGCRRFDGALTGLGGCPFAGDALVGNIPTETILSTLGVKGIATGVDPDALQSALATAHEIRSLYGLR